MPLRYTYLVLCLLGIVIPYAQFFPYALENGLDLMLFAHDLFASRVSSFLAWNGIIAALALFVFILVEGRRVNMRNLWLPVLGTFFVGVSFGLPLFLYMRELKLGQPARPL